MVIAPAFYSHLFVILLKISYLNSDIKPTSQNISIHWGDGRHDEYPVVWLRDNCQCSECYNKAARNRMLLMQDLDVNVSPEKVSPKDYQVYIVIEN